MAWSAAHELALTKRHIAEEETLRIVQLTRIADQMRHRQDIAAAEQALRHSEADLTALRARLRLCGATNERNGVPSVARVTHGYATSGEWHP
jgi:hypothetical protein